MPLPPPFQHAVGPRRPPPPTSWSVNVLTSCRKSAALFMRGQAKPSPVKKGSTNSRGPWNTSWPEEMTHTSSNRSNVSGCGCSSATSMVDCGRGRGRAGGEVRVGGLPGPVQLAERREGQKAGGAQV